VVVSIRPRTATAAWKKLGFGAFGKFPTAVRGGAGLGAVKAASSFDNFAVWDSSRPPQ
jgi:hypothetical protein